MSNIKRAILGGLLSATFLLSACGESESDTAMVSIRKTPSVKQAIQVQPKMTVKAVDISDVVQDNAKIQPGGKYMIMIFEAKGCKYCNQLKQDIQGNSDLKKRLTQMYATYLLDAGANQHHKFMHEGKLMDVDTNTLNDIYHINTTPTIVFSDKQAKSILLVPGYMPVKQFLVTLDFIDKGLWLNKDRKNGEVYKALKAYYIQKGVIQTK